MKPKYILFHTTDVSYRAIPNQLRSVDNYHKSLGYPLSRSGYSVGYHVLITGGKLYRTRLDSEVGAHCNTVVDGQSMNMQSLGVAVGFDGDVEYPTPEDTALLKQQIKEWQVWYGIPDENVKFHRDYNKGKTCPGVLITKEWLQNVLADTLPSKPADQLEKQKDILKQQITLLQRLIDLWIRLKGLV